MRTTTLVPLLFCIALPVGCDLAHEAEHTSDGGVIAIDSWFPVVDATPPAPCGPTVCGPGLVCCNASCGICTAPGDGCVDIVCGDADAGPPNIECGGIAGLACPAGFFCDFAIDAACGGGDQLGTCRPRPSGCPGGPPTVPVCGCDFRSYDSECEANLAGTSVRYSGGCPHPTPARPASATGTPTCGPTDGPAFAYVVTHGTPVCGPTSDATTSIEVNGDPTPHGVFAIHRDGTGGTASFCGAGASGPCVPLEGTVTLGEYVDGVLATLSYDLVDASGTHYPGADVHIDLWCPTQRPCR